MLNPTEQNKTNPNLLCLLNIDDSELTITGCNYKKATSGTVLDILCALAQKDKDIVSIMCGKWSRIAHLYITYCDHSVHLIKFSLPASSGYSAKPYATVKEYIKLINAVRTSRVDYSHTHRPIRVR